MRVVIVEDEPVSLDALRLRLEREPDVEVVGVAGTGAEAIRVITATLPDVVFLDIEIPPPNGFDVLSHVAADHLPAVVFVTAYDQFAIRAFDVHALDYLLKPVDQERVRRALSRARRALGDDADSAHDRLAAFLTGETDGERARPREEGPVGARPLRRLVARQGTRYRLVDVENVEWIESAGNYVRVGSSAGIHLVRSTLQAMEEGLDPDRFARIHRRVIVNIRHVRELVPISHGDCEVLLESGRTFRLSRSYRRNLLP